MKERPTTGTEIKIYKNIPLKTFFSLLEASSRSPDKTLSELLASQESAPTPTEQTQIPKAA